MKRRTVLVLACILVTVPLFADGAVDSLPFAYPAGIVYRLFTSAGVALLLMIRTIWNIIKDYNENHKASSVWSAVMKYLMVLGIVFLSLTALEFMFGNSPAFQSAKQALEGESVI